MGYTWSMHGLVIRLKDISEASQVEGSEEQQVELLELAHGGWDEHQHTKGCYRSELLIECMSRYVKNIQKTLFQIEPPPLPTELFFPSIKQFHNSDL